MLSKSIIAVSALASMASAQVHGAGALGTVMGPVAFLWPADRAWDGQHDNTGPCGSAASIVNRTEFPIGGMGSIETTIAEEAYNLAIRIAYGNNPTTQSAFQDVLSQNVSEVEPGHQCYPLHTDTSAVTPGTNATIQLEYWGNDSGTDESFFACADITFVDASDFTTEVTCFNVTSSEFTPTDPSASATSATSSPTATAGSSSETSAAAPAATAVSEKSGGGLSGGAKAGIAVGSIVGAALILAAAFFAIRRKRSGAAAKDAEAQPPMGKVVQPDAASIGSAVTAH